MNVTLTVPEGSTNHGNPKLLCTPPQWYDFVIFFFTNYVAHTATVVPEPGQSPMRASLHLLLALILPGSAVFRAIAAIMRHAATETKNPLRRAARAGALCMVLRVPAGERWARRTRRDILSEAESGNTVENTAPIEAPVSGPNDISELSATRNANEEGNKELPEPVAREPQNTAKEGTIPSSNSPWWEPPEGYARVPRSTLVHGEYWLHEDYYLAVVPPTASLTMAFDAGNREAGPPHNDDLHHSKAALASSHNLLKISISFTQAMWATATVYRARGDQIQQYGYAAFGLTVAPYAVMSILNMLANMLTPEYPSMFMIRTPAMADAEKEKKGGFKGAICVELHNSDTAEAAFTRRIGQILDDVTGLNEHPAYVADGPLSPLEIASLLLSLVPLAIVGGLSGFRQGNSSQLERGFTMSWLIVGIVYGVFFGPMGSGLGEMLWDIGFIGGWMFSQETALSERMKFLASVLVLLGGLTSLVVPAVGGMVMVGRMIRDFGVCILVD